MLLPIALSITAPVAALAAVAPNATMLPPPLETGLAAHIVWPSLATLTVPHGVGIPPEALAGLANATQFWPVAMIAGLAAWLMLLRKIRPVPSYVGQTQPAETPSQGAPDPAPTLLTPPVPACALQAQGADLAARARFVAMTFAFPDAGMTRPSLSGQRPTGWPLHMSCQPIRFTLTLRHAVLGYRLEFCNRGADPLGPLIIRADLIAAENRTAHHDQVEFAADALPLCHYLDSLPAGDSIELTGELRLPLAGIAAMRLGTAELLVPLMRLCAESAGQSQPALSDSACFAIGLPPLSAGGGIQPFRLDSGPGIWRKLTARQLLGGDLR